MSCEWFTQWLDQYLRQKFLAVSLKIWYNKSVPSHYCMNPCVKDSCLVGHGQSSTLAVKGLKFTALTTSSDPMEPTIILKNFKLCSCFWEWIDLCQGKSSRSTNIKEKFLSRVLKNITLQVWFLAVLLKFTLLQKHLAVLRNPQGIKKFSYFMHASENRWPMSRKKFSSD